jgi:hypothetical protein
MSMNFTDFAVVHWAEKERQAYIEGSTENAKLFALIAELTKENEDLKEKIWEMENV